MYSSCGVRYLAGCCVTGCEINDSWGSERRHRVLNLRSRGTGCNLQEAPSIKHDRNICVFSLKGGSKTA